MTQTANSPDSVLAALGKRPKQRTPVAARYLGLAEITLEADRASKKLGIPFHKIGRAVVYDLEELDQWLEQRREGRAA
jgi:hypothetical protein